MQSSNGLLLVIVGLLLLWLAISEKYQCATQAFDCLAGTGGGVTPQSVTPPFVNPPVPGGAPGSPDPRLKMPRKIPEIFQMPKIN